MEHTLINTIIASVVVAFIFGLIAKKMRLPAIFGYLLAGVAIGPYTPGFVADISLAKQLAEIGIILLMFGVGMHCSFKDLMNARKIALPGALFQMITATFIGTMVAMALGYSALEGIIFGFSLSVASTIVLIRSLEPRHLLDSSAGKIAIGWLIIEDIAMVLALVLLPILAEMMQDGATVNAGTIAAAIVEVLFKIGGLFAFMLLVGRRLLPKLLQLIENLHSSELTTLGTLAIALGFAMLAYTLFDASLALGAFLAGMVLTESEIGHRASHSSLPLREVFSVLFFVSVGMLLDPMTILHSPVAVLLTFLIIVGAKSLAAIAILHWLKQDRTTQQVVGIGLAQIGEFSFILGSLALAKGLIPPSLYSLILAGAMLSIVANPFLFYIFDYHQQRAAP